MAAKHPLWDPPADGYDPDRDARYQNTPRIVVHQGDECVVERPASTAERRPSDQRSKTSSGGRYDSESPVSWVSSLTLSEYVLCDLELRVRYTCKR